MKKLTTLTSLALLILSSNVFADGDDYTAFNGNGCEAYSASDKPFFNNQYNGIRNTSGVAKWVSCPVHKDSVSILGGTGTTWVRWSGAGNMTCTLNNFNVNGVRTLFRTGNGGPGWFSIANMGSDDFWGTYSMHCLVPAGSTLQTYHLNEI